jgi:hypothetical protein
MPDESSVHFSVRSAGADVLVLARYGCRRSASWQLWDRA